MITGTAENRNALLECETLKNSDNKNESESKSSSSIGNENGVDSIEESIQKPIFNIHFHMPEGERSNIKLYVPGIQPIVHFHFNEFPKNKELDIVIENGDTDFKKYTPKLENAIVADRSNSEGGNDFNLGSKRILRSFVKDSTDKISECTNQIKNHSNNSETLKNNCSNNKNGTNCMLGKNPVKLKKAIVVLTDILKTGYFQPRMDASTAENQIQGNRKKVGEVSGSTSLEEKSLVESNVAHNSSSQTMENTFDRTPLNTVNITPSKGRILTELAEGCSFSEILNRFRLSYSGILNKSTTPSKAIHSESCVSTEEHESESDKNVNFNEECLEEHGNKKLKFVRHNSEIDKEDTNSLNILENLLSSHSDGKVNMNCEDHKLFGLSQCSENSQSTEDNKQLTNSQDHVRESDHNGCVTEVQSSSGRASVGQEIIDPSKVTSYEIENSSFNVAERCEGNFCSLKTLSPGLEKDKEKMRGRTLLKTKKNKKERSKTSERKSTMSKSSTKLTKSCHSSPAKKIEASKPQTRKGKIAQSMAADYIPLEAPGATKFGVALLSEIQPYKCHDAKNFKREMLFGDRVKRYSSPRDLKVYKLKQEAARLSS